MRKTPKQLEEIKKKYRVEQLYSWSKYNTYKNSIYEYFLKYIKKVKEDRNDGIYGISGNACHEILENLYGKKLNYEDMITSYENSLFEFNIAELKYDRTDEEKNKKIADKYEYCLRHFFQNHQIINKKVDIERFILIQIGKFLFQGYIDFIFKDGSDFIIQDWKTSSIYTGKKIDKEKGQLVLYAEGLRQLGVPIENIKIRWCFLKYITVEIQQANGKIISRNISRHEIGVSLKTNAKMWLKKEQCYSEEEIESYLDMMELNNSIDCLPKNVRLKYKVSDCYVYIPFNQGEIDNLKEDIINTLIEINKKEIEYLKTKDENIWYEEITDEKSYYFANLSGYSANLHKPYADYLEGLKMFHTNNEEDSDSEDMSWLDEI